SWELKIIQTTLQQLSKLDSRIANPIAPPCSDVQAVWPRSSVEVRPSIGVIPRCKRFASCFANDAVCNSQGIWQKAVIIAEIGNPTIFHVRQREFKIARHANTAAGVYVPDTTIADAAHDLFSIILAEIVTHQDLEVRVSLTHDRLQTMIQRIRAFPR